ncbi:MAG: phosphotransferase, partial [Actinomycetota bacterium]
MARGDPPLLRARGLGRQREVVREAVGTTPGRDGLRRVSASPPARTIEWARSSLGKHARVLRIEPMPLASHTNHRLVVQTGNGAQSAFVLRRYTDEERLMDDPWYVPRDEVLALQTLESVDLPVSRLVVADTDAVECDVPTLLVTWLPGSPPDTPGDVASVVRQMAAALHEIHATEA